MLVDRRTFLTGAVAVGAVAALPAMASQYVEGTIVGHITVPNLAPFSSMFQHLRVDHVQSMGLRVRTVNEPIYVHTVFFKSADNAGIFGSLSTEDDVVANTFSELKRRNAVISLQFVPHEDPQFIIEDMDAECVT